MLTEIARQEPRVGIVATARAETNSERDVRSFVEIRNVGCGRNTNNRDQCSATVEYPQRSPGSFHDFLSERPDSCCQSTRAPSETPEIGLAASGNGASAGGAALSAAAGTGAGVTGCCSSCVRRFLAN